MTKQQFLQQFNCTVEDTKNLTGNKALESVKENGNSLRFVKEQTEEICLQAVKQDSYSLQYVDLDVFLDTKQTVTLELTDEQLEKIKSILDK